MDAPPRERRTGWKLVLLLLGLGAMALAGFLFYQARSLPGEILDKGRSLVGDLRTVAEGFRTGTVSMTFVSYATEMTGSQHLQFATLKEMEVFERTDRVAVLWGQLALPDVVVRAQAPVEYTYYLDLEDTWDFELEGQTVVVHAPPIRFNTPAIDVSRLRYEVRTGSVLRNEERALQNLRRGLTDLAKRRAQENVELVRELGRKKTEEFVRTWLLSRYEDADSYRVSVLFPDEQLPQERPPALR